MRLRLKETLQIKRTVDDQFKEVKAELARVEEEYPARIVELKQNITSTNEMTAMHEAESEELRNKLEELKLKIQLKNSKS